MTDWRTVQIGELLASYWPGEWGEEPSPNKTHALVYRSTELSDEGHVHPSNVERHITATKLAAKKLAPGDILLEASGGTPERPVGRVGLYSPEHPETAICSNFLRTLRPKADVNPPYLRWVLMHLHQRPEIWRFQQQTTGMSNLHVKDYLRHKVVIPSLSKQKRIAEILSTIDESIQKTECLITKIQQIKAGLMHDLLTRGLTENGLLRSPRKESPQLYKESLIGWIPKEWETQSASEATDLITVGVVIRPAQYYVEEGIPAFRSANIREEGIESSDIVFISPESNALLAKSQVQPGDVLSVRTGYPGTSAVVPDEFAGANCVDVLISRPSNRLNSDFYALWINSPFGKEQVLRKQGGLAQQHFNVGELRQLIIALPDQEEQERIVMRLQAVNERIKQEKLLAQRYRYLKAGLMNDFLTGSNFSLLDSSMDLNEVDADV